MPVTDFNVQDKYQYQTGFGSHHETEAVPGALPVGQNSPQKPAYGLYAEKLSGTSFTTPRHLNQQAWLYRILPAAAHSPFELVGSDGYDFRPWSTKWHHVPNQLRWDPFDIDETVDYVHGMKLVAGAGDPSIKSGLGIYIFSAGKSMNAKEAFYSADGDLLLVLQHGVMEIRTELGQLLVRPNEIVIIPRGIRHRVDLVGGPIRGYALELYQGHFQLPELGPIGTNGLANPRDFQAPSAAYIHDISSEWTLFSKFNGQLFSAKQNHTPFDVVAWHGNYCPYKYDLGRFNTIGSISFDHPDPSIFTVLSAPSDTPGVAIADFVIFPPRWLVQEDTFRPPYYHRNTMSEFMGLIGGDYDAKAGGKGGFQPGGASLHNVMNAHGPDAVSHQKASEAKLEPRKEGASSMAFMFESCLMVGVTEWGLKECQKVQEKYNAHSWEPLKAHFKPPGTSGHLSNEVACYLESVKSD